MDVRSNGSQESLHERASGIQSKASIGHISSFKPKQPKTTALTYPTTEKKKESSDHGNVKNYLAQLRSKRVANENKPKNYNNHNAYASNFTNLEDMKSDGGLSALQTRPVADASLRKLLSDPNMSENDRVNAVRMRTEQIEKKAAREE